MKLQAAKTKKKKIKGDYLEAMGNPVAGKILTKKGQVGKIKITNG